MILSDREILAAVGKGEIVIDPFDERSLGGNSYDVHLSPTLRVYRTRTVAQSRHCLGVELGAQRWTDDPDDLDDLDMAREPETIDVRIPERGIVLAPGILYLASTVEYTETHRHVPYLDGRSSVGRLGVSIHVTAGRGDVGFCNHWTMEIWVVQPIRVYAGIRIGQLTYHTVTGDVDRRYDTKENTTYGGLARDPMPQPSRMWKRLI